MLGPDWTSTKSGMSGTQDGIAEASTIFLRNRHKRFYGSFVFASISGAKKELFALGRLHSTTELRPPTYENRPKRTKVNAEVLADPWQLGFAWQRRQLIAPLRRSHIPAVACFAMGESPYAGVQPLTM